MNIDQFLITLDVDWAPDYMVDYVASILISHRVKATWFVTHESLSVWRLRKRNDLFELGVHPNFLTGSTHGNNSLDVLNHVRDYRARSCIVGDGRKAKSGRS